jgi:predicted nucleic acid-binding protein
MNLVVDTNIIISALITPEGTISRLLLQDLADSQLISPHFLFDEIISKYDKIQSITRLSDEDLKELFYLLIKHIDFIDNDLISFENQKKAFTLVSDIDKKDLLFVALSIQTGFSLWSGDLKLVKGLKTRGFASVLETKEIVERINK